MDTILYQSLKEAYAIENLNKLCAKILQLYKHKLYESLRKLLKTINDPSADTAHDRQLLTKLMLRYHPDKYAYYHKTLADANPDDLAEMASILKLQTVLESLNATENGYSNGVVNYNVNEEELIWENETQTNPIWENDDDLNTDTYFGEADRTLFSAFKDSIYGDQNIELPLSLLEDIDELELADRGIESLEGVQYFYQLQQLDVSGNSLTNLDELEGLVLLEELVASENEIGYIDSLSFLEKLRIVDLSSNQIDDISAILQLPNLEFVNLVGNKIPKQQIEKLKAKGCMVLY